MRRVFLFAALLSASIASAVSQQIPSGTVLPVMTTRSLDAAKAQPGDRLSARLMQDVSLPSGETIRAGARVDGQVVQSSSSREQRIIVRFDRLVFDGKKIPIAVSLRALASMLDVFDAQLPTSTFDEYGTSISDWTTVQIGGAAVYHGDQTVREAMDIVGRAPHYNATIAKVVAAPKRGCPTDNGKEQSLWVFSPWACGTYGFEDLAISHHGTTPPVGDIELTSPKAFRVRGGSGWLLQVVASPSEDASLSR
jgi:hypothetical protein